MKYLIVVIFALITLNSGNLIEYEKPVFVNKDVQLKLMTGLRYEMLTWHHEDTILKTPQNLIMNFPFKGDYVPHIRHSKQKDYTITVE